MITRVSAIVAACCLLLVPAGLASSAQAAVISTSVPCTDGSGSLTVAPGDSLVFNASTCTIDDTSLSPGSGVVAFVSDEPWTYSAVGEGTVTVSFFTSDDTQYDLAITVTSTPSPTAPTPSATPAYPANVGPGAVGPACPWGGRLNAEGDLCLGTESPPTPSPSPTGTASLVPTPVPFETADAAAPQASQLLRPRDVQVGQGLEPGEVAFFNDKGHPLQLLSISGDREAVRILNRGMDYSAQPANWQRLGYGDLCWTYAGYRGVEGLVLPVATPPFATVPADWVLTAAIATTSSGNRIILDPVPGQLLTADGRDVNAVTLCANGYASTAVEAAAVRQFRKDHNSGNANSGNGAGNIGGNVGTGQCRGNGNFKHGCEPSYPGVTGGGVVIPAITKEPVTTSTQVETQTPSETPTTSPSPEGDPLVPVCRATEDPRNPYRFETVRSSQIEDGQGDRLFPTEGWTDVIPPVPGITAGQNWPEGAGMLSAANKCQVTQPAREPSPTPTPTSEETVTALPQPTFSESTPVMTASAVPQPSFTSYTSIVPWPPLYPIPVPTPLLVPAPTPSPTQITASPVASPPAPSATATPAPETATPDSRPTVPPLPSPALPTTSATGTPDATPPPVTQTPFPIPASPAPRPTRSASPTASLATPTPMPKVPTLIPPLQEPSVPLTPVIALREPGTVVASPTASPTPKPRPTASGTVAPTAVPTTKGTPSPTATPTVPDSTATGTAEPTPVPDPEVTAASPLASPPSVTSTATDSAAPTGSPTPEASLASPVATPPSPTPARGTPIPTATPSPEASLASPTATPSLPSAEPTPSSTGGRPGPTGSRTVTLLLTNGPDTVRYTTTIAALLSVAAQTDGGVAASSDGGPGGTTGGTTDGKPGTGTGPTELANTGSTEAWLIIGGITLAGGAVLLLPVARGRRLRIGVVVGLTITGLVTSTTAAWSVASAERAFGIAQAQASAEWGSSPEAMARLTFVRPGGTSPIGPEPVYVFDGIDEDTLTRGPGWYPTTSRPGSAGTTAIAGHRTGYGSPFAELDELRSGDMIVMQTPADERRTYRVDQVRLVDTDDVWVLGPDPLGTGTSTLTLTTCDPPGVNTKRLVVIASLVSGSSPA